MSLYVCNNWTCPDTKVYDTQVPCYSCKIIVKPEKFRNDINRVFSLAKLYIESRSDVSKEQVLLATTKIENIHQELRDNYLKPKD